MKDLNYAIAQTRKMINLANSTTGNSDENTTTCIGALAGMSEQEIEEVLGKGNNKIPSVFTIEKQTQRLIDFSNSITGKNNDNLKDCVDALISLNTGVYKYKAPEIKSAFCDKYANPNDPMAWYHEGHCKIQGSNDWIYRTFLQYDLSGIPDGATVKSAYLYVWGNGRNDNTSQGTTNIARVTTDWAEETICWNNMPSYEGRYLETDVYAPELEMWASWDITELVSEWVNGTYPNYGLHILNNNEGAYRVNWSIATRFHPYPEFATYIQVEYEVQK